MQALTNRFSIVLLGMYISERAKHSYDTNSFRLLTGLLVGLAFHLLFLWN